ncbi:MAG: FHA domain-containing protein [Gemmatimonadales bacterium]|nr:FHA domain-containing protein [Gemmatimonadales bacterium]NIN11220.1 FHA domain-containing protein [Gemmatimonadales bacterium]NIN49819.1 FHA domain-containing protein [Gemmatimonadales bacterium]NIP07283.1 FHA domain-containing protein [Gemmatimonadales bacterium]NIR02978.1 FHA domain-containing protein [Gemmatimonadales bacterium]
MKAQLRILSGARTGHTEVFSIARIGIGRHPASDLQFDPERDLDVSARHATIILENDEWLVRDLGSRNGTLVNGHRISRVTKLDDTDQIRFGEHGPTLEFRLVPEGTPDGVVARAAAPEKPPPAEGPVRATGATEEPRRMSTTERIRVEVRRETRTLRRTTVVLFATLLAVAAAFFYQNHRQESLRQREIATIQARTDSLLRVADQAVQVLQGQVEGLANALRQSQDQVGRLRQQLATAQAVGNQADVEVLKDQLAAATQALRYQELAARVDYRGIVESNQRATAIIWVEFGPGEVSTGTAFAVRSDGTLLTNRHVVAGEDGSRRPRQIAIQFADSRQVVPARLLGTSREADLAAVKVDFDGGVPTVQGLNGRPDTLHQGDPVAVIGFPLGPDLPMATGGGGRPIAKSSFSAGSVSKVLQDLIQVDGYGTHGASGSPIFDRTGQVVAILFGGQQGSGGRIVFGVPANYAIRLLQSLN